MNNEKRHSTMDAMDSFCKETLHRKPNKKETEIIKDPLEHYEGLKPIEKKGVYRFYHYKNNIEQKKVGWDPHETPGTHKHRKGEFHQKIAHGSFRRNAIRWALIAVALSEKKEKIADPGDIHKEMKAESAAEANEAEANEVEANEAEADEEEANEEEANEAEAEAEADEAEADEEADEAEADEEETELNEGIEPKDPDGNEEAQADQNEAVSSVEQRKNENEGEDIFDDSQDEGEAYNPNADNPEVFDAPYDELTINCTPQRAENRHETQRLSTWRGKRIIDGQDSRRTKPTNGHSGAFEVSIQHKHGVVDVEEHSTTLLYRINQSPLKDIRNTIDTSFEGSNVEERHIQNNRAATESPSYSRYKNRDQTNNDAERRPREAYHANELSPCSQYTNHKQAKRHEESRSREAHATNKPSSDSHNEKKEATGFTWGPPVTYRVVRGPESVALNSHDIQNPEEPSCCPPLGDRKPAPCYEPICVATGKEVEQLKSENQRLQKALQEEQEARRSERNKVQDWLQRNLDQNQELNNFLSTANEI